MRRPLNGPFLILLTSLGLAACTPTAVKPLDTDPVTPERWQSDSVSGAVASGWLSQLNDERLSALVMQGMETNRGLAQSRAQLIQAQQQLLITGADQLPGLELSGSGRRAESGQSIGESASLDLQLRYELDLWGRLDDQSRQAGLTLAASQAALNNSREQLAADISRGWFNLQQAQMLLVLFEQRRDNLAQNLELIQSRYQQGLSTALDVYLARNNLRSEQARVAEQKQTRLEARRSLEQLLGEYPAGLIAVQGELPLLDVAIPAGLPADLIRRRPDLQQAWLQLLAADASVAVAHKARFPSLTLTGNLGQSSGDLTDLLSSGNLTWALAAAVGQTLFDGGRKEATEGLRLAQRSEQEQRYLDAVNRAFEEVENLLSNHQSLIEQYNFYLDARSNADAAEVLAFEQYQKGLANFTTVLESQRRAFDARSTVINLRNQLLLNRVALYRALGGRFETAQSNTADTTGTDA